MSKENCSLVTFIISSFVGVVSSAPASGDIYQPIMCVYQPSALWCCPVMPLFLGSLSAQTCPRLFQGGNWWCWWWWVLVSFVKSRRWKMGPKGRQNSHSPPTLRSPVVSEEPGNSWPGWPAWVPRMVLQGSCSSWCPWPCLPQQCILSLLL